MSYFSMSYFSSSGYFSCSGFINSDVRSKLLTVIPRMDFKPEILDLPNSDILELHSLSKEEKS